MSISKREAERYLTCILDAIMDNLKSEGRVVVQGFGSFKLKDHYVDTFRRFCDEPDQYTWWSFRFDARKRNIGWRIDYFFVTEDLIGKVKDSFICPGVMGSDHCPIGLDISVS